MTLALHAAWVLICILGLIFSIQFACDRRRSRWWAYAAGIYTVFATYAIILDIMDFICAI